MPCMAHILLDMHANTVWLTLHDFLRDRLLIWLACMSPEGIAASLLYMRPLPGCKVPALLPLPTSSLHSEADKNPVVITAPACAVKVMVDQHSTWPDTTRAEW